ncbi:MAG: shikimate kinase [Candidatus Omnitrophota bacterium]
MGTGKTETARALATRLGRVFVDMDELIEERQGMSISDIFKVKGEPYFRSLEKALVKELAARDGLVVSCGGGTFADGGNITELKRSGTVICLTSSPQQILQRTKGYHHRPLLNVTDPEALICGLLEKRAPFYVQAHHQINTDQLTIEETVNIVLTLVKND